jgi:hypothetical protein
LLPVQHASDGILVCFSLTAHWFGLFLCLLACSLLVMVCMPPDEIQSELITATEIKQLFLDMLTETDEASIHCDVIAAATRSPSVELAVLAILFHTGLHALVCYRVGHRLWRADRTGLAKYLQSTVSRHYSADVHPACSMGQGIYLCTAAGVGKPRKIHVMDSVVCDAGGGFVSKRCFALHFHPLILSLNF